MSVKIRVSTTPNSVVVQSGGPTPMTPDPSHWLDIPLVQCLHIFLFIKSRKRELKAKLILFWFPFFFLSLIFHSLSEMRWKREQSSVLSRSSCSFLDAALWHTAQTNQQGKHVDGGPNDPFGHTTSVVLSRRIGVAWQAELVCIDYFGHHSQKGHPSLFHWWEAKRDQICCLLWIDEAKSNIKPMYECRCNGRLQTKRFTRLSHTGLVVELEHLKIKTRLTNEKFASVKGECEI